MRSLHQCTDLHVLEHPLVKSPVFQHFAVHHVYKFCTLGHDEFLILERAKMLCVWVGLVVSNRPFVGQQQTFCRVTRFCVRGTTDFLPVTNSVFYQHFFGTI